MERSNTHNEYEMDCTQHNGFYNKTYERWLYIEKEKEKKYKINNDPKEKVSDKKEEKKS